MAFMGQLIQTQSNGSISFGNHELLEKSKVEDFQHCGDLYKVKTYHKMTKLEKNGMFVYESVPGTTVSNFMEDENGVEFGVKGNSDAQITVGLKDDTEYNVIISDESSGVMVTNVGGKLSINVELSGVEEISVKIVK